MDPSRTIVPFRWDIARPHELGALINVDPAPAYPAFADDLRACCAGVLAAAGDADLVFVGRSPESLHDYLRGICLGTSWQDRIGLLLISLRYGRPAMRRVAALQRYLATLGLDPRELPRRDRPVALIDLVSSGETFCALVRMLHRWTLAKHGDWRAVRDKLRIVALVEQSFSIRSRWPEQRRRASGGGVLKRNHVHGVSVPERAWSYLGNEQIKVAESHTPDFWDDERAARPPRHPNRAAALRAAVEIFRRARDRPERVLFMKELSRHGALRHEAIRDLVAELRFGHRSFARTRAGSRRLVPA